MKTTTILEIAKKEGDAINRHDADAYAAGYSADATAYDPQYPESLKGREAIRQDIVDFFTAFPDVQSKVLSFVTNGDILAFEVEMSGTHKGPLITPNGAIPATNKSMQMRGARFMRVNSQGQIIECNRYYDLAGIMMQLGLM
jgi:steroid delta-isomerase-like uncharacterized protein